MPRLLRPSRYWCSEAHSTESKLVQETKLAHQVLVTVSDSLNISPAGPPLRARTAHVPRALWPVKYRADMIEETNVIEELETIAVQSLLANQ